MKFVFVVCAAVLLLHLCSLSQADVFNLGPGLINLETVTVGDVGNAGQLAGAGVPGGFGDDAVCGSVSYEYSIGKYEVTTAQYCDFLNHKAKSDPYELYNIWYMADFTNFSGCNIQRTGSDGNYSYTVGDGSESDLSAWGNKPVNYVSFWDACRFANWLGNGQGDGDTETGAYSLNGQHGWFWDDGAIVRNAGATWAVTSEDEWYKAAYYKGGGTDSGYWDYPTQSNSIDASAANYDDMFTGHTTDVGFYGNPSAYGTYDQGGNVQEWNESVSNGDARGLSGGSFWYPDFALRASTRMCGTAMQDCNDVGFRLSLVSVPEPSSIIALLGGLTGCLGLRRRRG